MSATELDRFAAAYVAQWETRSTVRTARRFQLTEAIAANDLYPQLMDPLTAHPRVAERGPDARRFLLTQAAYTFMEEIALLETDTVALLAASLAHRPHRVPLSPAVREAALTVSVDEAYHAFAASEFIHRATELTGIAPMAPLTSPAQVGIAHAAARANLPAAVGDDWDIVALCIAENVVTHEVLGMTRDTPPTNAFHIACEEHLADETQHQAFFQRVLRHYWRELDATTREAIGEALPVFFHHFFGDATRFRTRSVAILRAVGLDEASAHEILAELFDPFPATQHPMARNAIRLLEKTGVLDHAPTGAALARDGWV